MPTALSEEQIAALATLFSTAASARRLLESAGLPRARQPAWQDVTPLTYWHEMNTQFAGGILVDGIARLLAAARRAYPGIPVFENPLDSPTDDEPAASPEPMSQGSSLPGIAGGAAFDLRGAKGIVIGNHTVQTNIFHT